METFFPSERISRISPISSYSVLVFCFPFCFVVRRLLVRSIGQRHKDRGGTAFKELDSSPSYFPPTSTAPSFNCSFKMKSSSLPAPSSASHSCSLMLYTLTCKLIPQKSSQQPPPGASYPSRSRSSCASFRVLSTALHQADSSGPSLTPSERRVKSSELG